MVSLGYNKYTYNFYGVGKIIRKIMSKNTVLNIQARITALKKIGKHFYAGPRYAFDNLAY